MWLSLRHESALSCGTPPQNVKYVALSQSSSQRACPQADLTSITCSTTKGKNKLSKEFHGTVQGNLQCYNIQRSSGKFVAICEQFGTVTFRYFMRYRSGDQSGHGSCTFADSESCTGRMKQRRKGNRCIVRSRRPRRCMYCDIVKTNGQ